MRPLLPRNGPVCTVVTATVAGAKARVNSNAPRLAALVMTTLTVTLPPTVVVATTGWMPIPTT
ncbi:MAG: hypothetical protein WAS51_10430, partial [Ilumatobacteraceae bacterium]